VFVHLFLDFGQTLQVHHFIQFVAPFLQIPDFAHVVVDAGLGLLDAVLQFSELDLHVGSLSRKLSVPEGQILFY
jgi:hypothetical protein